MRSPASLPHDLPPVFRVDRGLNLGVTRERMRRSDLHRPFRGVRATSDEGDNTLRGALAAARPGSFLTHLSAARVWGVPLPPWMDSEMEVHIGNRGGTHPTRVEGVRDHRLRIEERDIVVRDGLAVTSPARTWCDLATVLSEENLVAAGDFLLWRRAPQVTLIALMDAARRHTGRRGRPARRIALPLLSDRADSAPESILRVRIIRAGLPMPLVNEPLYDRHGRFLAMPDLVFPDQRELVEYEGSHHLTDHDQWAKDLRRVPRLEDEGWHTTRAGRSDLADSSELLTRLTRRLARSLPSQRPRPSP